MLNGASWLKRMLLPSPDLKSKIRRHRLVESDVASPSNNFNPGMSNRDSGGPTSLERGLLQSLASVDSNAPPTPKKYGLAGSGLFNWGESGNNMAIIAPSPEIALQ